MIDLHYEVSVMTHCQCLTSSVKPKPGVKLGQNVEILAGVRAQATDFLKSFKKAILEVARIKGMRVNGIKHFMCVLT